MSVPPWRKSPSRARKRGTLKLTPELKSKARQRAKRAGRPYPNLVDNMTVARQAGRKATKAPRSPKKGRAPAKDPKGGLTAAGRADFARQGSHLRPGVKKRVADMTPQEMRRKGSWAVRFYGRAGRLPSLTDRSGKRRGSP